MHLCPPSLQIPNSAPKAGLEACGEGRCHATTRADPGGEGGVGMVWVHRGHYSPHHGGPGQEGHSQGRSRRLAPWMGKSHRQGGRRGREAGRLGGWWGGLGPGSNAGGSPLGAGTRPFHGSTRRLYQAACPPLPCGRTSAWAPSSQRERCGGDEGNSVAETRADRGQPRTGDHGAQIPGAPPRKQTQAHVTRASPGRREAQVLGTLGWRRPRPTPPLHPQDRPASTPPALPCPTAPQFWGP